MLIPKDPSVANDGCPKWRSYGGLIGAAAAAVSAAAVTVNGAI